MMNNYEFATCPTLDDPANYHFENRCEDCDIQRMAKMRLDTVDSLYRQSRVTQAQFEAYMYVWARLSPHGGRPEWMTVPTDPDVRRIARKLLRAGGFGIPAGMHLDD
jgi:hypothetical protein